MKSAIVLFILCGLIGGCGSSPLRSAQAKDPPTAAGKREATVIFISEGTLNADAAKSYQTVSCIPPPKPPASESGGLAPFLIPLAGMAADTLVNAVSSMLTKAKDNRSGTWTASLGGVALLPGNNYCLAVSRGIISDATGGAATSALNTGLSFDGEPAFVMFADLSVTTSKDPALGIGLKLTPKLLSYAETSAPSRGKKKKDVSVLLAFNGTAKSQDKTTKPDKPAQPAAGEAGGAAAPAAGTKDAKKDDTKKGDKPAPATDDGSKPSGSTPPPNSLRLDFGRLEIGKVYGVTLLLPTAGSVTVDSGGLFTVSAVVTESEDPGVALTAFASAFDSNKDDLTAALKKALGVPQQTPKK